MTASHPPTAHHVSLALADDAEEAARAELYGLLARLWLAPPDAALLAQFREAPTRAPQAGAFLEAPWQALVEAMRATTPAQAADEHLALFHGVGKSEVCAYASYYLSGYLHERPLAELRTELARLGLAREEGSLETEDHIAYELEVMRWLITGDDPALCNLEQQRRFFRAHLQPWVDSLCDAVQAHPRSQVWRALAGCTRAFMQVETQAFDLLET